MKMAPVTYHRPSSLDDALVLLAELDDDAKVLAGGQSLLPLMAMRLAAPAHLVDIAGIGLDTIASDDTGIRIGACVRHGQAERSPLVRAHVPLLAEALTQVGHRAIRTRGTVCGSLAHADPAAELPAVALALDATMIVRSTATTRSIPAADFFTGYLTTVLGPGELLTEVVFPYRPDRSGSAVYEVSRRHGDFALVGAAVEVALDAQGHPASAAVALFGVAPTPVRVEAAEAALVTGATLDRVAEVIRESIDPTGDVHATAAYRRHVAGVVSRRALALALERARAGAAGSRATGPAEHHPPPSAATTMVVNGRTVSIDAEPRRTLVEVLRDDLVLTGTHVGCEHGVCGACTVLVDGEPARSCLMLAAQAAGTRIETIESLAGDDGRFHPIQAAMIDSHGFQCAFCAPGFLMTIKALLDRDPTPDQDTVREELAGNLCRCTGYASILAGVEAVIRTNRGETNSGDEGSDHA